VGREPRPSGGPWPAVLGPRSRAACALSMSRREMLGERQVAAPLMAQRAARGALRPAHRRFQPGEGAGVQLGGLRLGGKPQRPSQGQFGHETPVLALALVAPAASRPGQHCAVRRRRGRQVAPRDHASTVGQRFLRLALRDDQEERRRTSSPALAGRTPVRTVAAHVTAGTRAVIKSSFSSSLHGGPRLRAADSRTDCIFMHRPAWGERPLLPHRVRHLGGDADRGSRRRG
jgi:hypothetical protein